MLLRSREPSVSGDDRLDHPIGRYRSRPRRSILSGEGAHDVSRSDDYEGLDGLAMIVGWILCGLIVIVVVGFIGFLVWPNNAGKGRWS
jgi:hypothetical protein